MNFSHRTDPMLLQEIFQTPFSNNNNKIKRDGGGGGGYRPEERQKKQTHYANIIEYSRYIVPADYYQLKKEKEKRKHQELFLLRVQ